MFQHSCRRWSSDFLSGVPVKLSCDVRGWDKGVEDNGSMILSLERPDKAQRGIGAGFKLNEV